MDRRLWVSCALFSVAACSELPRPAGPALEAAALPVYRVGDSVSWSNGQTEMVVAVDGEVVRWRDQDGNSFSGYRNFALPSLAWDYPETRAETAMAVEPRSLWPLAAGKQADFVVNQRLTLKIHDSEIAYHDEWSCRVDGSERIFIRLGGFDTWRVRCKRFWRGSNIGEIVWNYAPSLGRVVRRTWTGAKEPEELVAIGSGNLGTAAEKVAARVRQHGLETAASRAKAVGRTKAVEVTVEPKATFVTDAGRYCRDFIQKISTASAVATAAGSACRGDDGAWTVIDTQEPAD